jgi:hypothetical protein
MKNKGGKKHLAFLIYRYKLKELGQMRAFLF